MNFVWRRGWRRPRPRLEQDSTPGSGPGPGAANSRRNRPLNDFELAVLADDLDDLRKMIRFRGRMPGEHLVVSNEELLGQLYRVKEPQIRLIRELERY